ncbi:MAG TPA: anti-sigma factor [Aquihabitans sp.]|jgi:hypothetical protein|nr:anti-sigma factor [Aquihabitans sp.]
MTEYHDDFTDLLGVYALDAVDPLERQRIEAHLLTCHWCAAEVAQHREVAAHLSVTGTDAPAGVWDRIAAELSPPAPPLRMSFSPTGEVDPLGPSSTAPPAAPDNVVPLRRRSISMRTFAAVVGTAAVLLGALGFVAVDRTRDANQIATSTTTPGPGDLTVALEGSGRLGAQAVVDASGKGYLVSHDLPDPGEDRLYQLWGQVDGVVLSLGTFDSGTEVVNFTVDPAQIDDVEAFAVTEEQRPGVLASENEAVLIGEVA